MCAAMNTSSSSENDAGHQEFVNDALLSNCSSCKEEGRAAQAVRYCVDCEEYQCNQCFRLHQRYTNKGHEVYDESFSQKWGTKKPMKLPTQRCPNHVGEILQLYCEHHDALCCHVCIAMEHSSCPRKLYIPEVARGIGKSRDLTLVLNDINVVQSYLNRIVKESKANKASLEKSRDTFKEQLAELRRSFETCYAKLEQNAVVEVNSAHDKITREVDESIHVSYEMLDELDVHRQSLMPSDKTSESQLYVRMKLALKHVKHLDRKLSWLSQPRPICIACKTIPEINKLLKKGAGLVTLNTIKTEGTAINDLFMRRRWQRPR